MVNIGALWERWAIFIFLNRGGCDKRGEAHKMWKPPEWYSGCLLEEEEK